MLLCTYIKCFDFRRENTSVPCATKGDRQGLECAKKSSDIPAGTWRILFAQSFNPFPGWLREKSSSFPPSSIRASVFHAKTAYTFLSDAPHPSECRLFLFAQAFVWTSDTGFSCPRNSNTPYRLRAALRLKKRSEIMKRTEKNSETRSSNLPISIGLVLKIAFVVTGFALWGWSFVAVVVGIRIAFAVVKTLLSCLVSLLVLAIIITLAIGLIF